MYITSLDIANAKSKRKKFRRPETTNKLLCTTFIKLHKTRKCTNFCMQFSIEGNREVEKGLQILVNTCVKEEYKLDQDRVLTMENSILPEIRLHQFKLHQHGLRNLTLQDNAVPRIYDTDIMKKINEICTLMEGLHVHHNNKPPPSRIV